MSHKITLVDDDQNILTSVSIALEEEGFIVDAFTDGRAALDKLKDTPSDLVVLDVKMPRMDGMEVLKTLRQTSEVPVIFLTSKDDEIDQILGLRMGADDYITKPFSQRLLIERIRSLLRRQSLNTTSSNDVSDDAQSQIKRGSLKLDDARHICSWKDQHIALTVTEYLILRALAHRPGLVKNREQLMDIAYGESVYVDDRTVDSHIKRIRKKFRKSDPEFSQIETLYGVGYRYKEETAQ
tara:strand:- start:1993 stop:2709 length:717 start_codon:yes stop_codon:yes gene_type:complete